MLERILPEPALHRIHDPGHVAHQADHPRLGKDLHQRGQIGRPGAVGVEDHRGFMLGVIALEETPQQPRALCLGDAGRKLGARRDLRDHAIEERSDGAGHAGMKARVLPQQRRRQGRARARQARNELIDSIRHAGLRLSWLQGRRERPRLRS
jgi:hypothetical protein